MTLQSEVAAPPLDGHPSNPSTVSSLTHPCDRPIVIAPATSRLVRCGICTDQLRPSDYGSRMIELEQAAHRFWERELGKPYVEFRGVARQLGVSA